MDYANINKIDFSQDGVMSLKSASNKVYNVPLDKNGALFINWQGKFGDSFFHCSYLDVFNAFDDYSKGKDPIIETYMGKRVFKENALEFFKDKICIVGFTTAGLVDQKPVPIENRYPLVGLHANIIENIMNSDYFIPINYKSMILIICFVCLLAAVLVFVFPVVWSVITSILFSLFLS